MPDSAISTLPASADMSGPGAAVQRPDWGSLWRLLVVQTQNAFNDKVAQFTLLGMAKVFLDKAASERYPHIVSALLVVPLLFFAPVAGWVSDLLRVTTVNRAVTPSNVLVPLTWTSDKGLRYRVQRSLDLQTWTDVPGDITATGTTSTATMAEALGINRLFYRVKEVNP